MDFRPHAYQDYCIKALLEKENLGLFLDMGLGKTIITLTAINELKFYRFQVNKVLVIAPKKVAEATWQKEIKKWAHLNKIRISTILGTKKQRIAAVHANADIYIINRDNVTWLVDYFRNAWPFDMVVIDEFSSFKNRKSKRFKALNSIRPHIKRFVGLTGTPSPNGIEDLWAQVYLLDGGERLCKSYSQYMDIYFKPGRRQGYVVFDYKLLPGSSDKILDKIKDICISLKAEDYLELPDIIEHEIPVVLDPKAYKKYEELEKTMVLEISEEEDITAFSAAALSNKLLQLANGAIYDEDSKWHEIHSAKLEAFMELVEQLNGSPAIVFYNYRHDKERILDALKPLGLEVRELGGAQDETDWNDKKINILLTHPASSAFGLNLQEGGNHVIWFGLPWNYELYVQANKRLHRQGQKEKVIVHQLITQNTRDQDVSEALQRKEDAQDYVLETLKARIDKYRKGAK